MCAMLLGQRSHVISSHLPELGPLTPGLGQQLVDLTGQVLAEFGRLRPMLIPHRRKSGQLLLIRGPFRSTSADSDPTLPRFDRIGASLNQFGPNSARNRPISARFRVLGKLSRISPNSRGGTRFTPERALNNLACCVLCPQPAWLHRSGLWALEHTAFGGATGVCARVPAAAAVRGDAPAPQRVPHRPERVRQPKGPHRLLPSQRRRRLGLRRLRGALRAAGRGGRLRLSAGP